MKTNTFTIQMSKKSNFELETILEEKSKYTNEAIQAVVVELEERALKGTYNIKKSLAKFQKEVALSEEIILESRPAKVLEDGESVFEELIVPVLYSKRAIRGFSILFSTIFGVVLLMSNLKALQKPKARMQVFCFGVLYAILSYTVLNLLPQMFLSTLLINLIGSAFLTEFFWNQSIEKEVDYRNKEIWKPLIISVIILLVIVLLQLLLGVIPE